MKFILTARAKTQTNTDYLTLKEHLLDATQIIIDGNGSVESPFCAKIKITNKRDIPWSGIIHIEMPFHKRNPRYFLPAFLYGRNRGEYPQNVPNEFPRLREEMNRPSSPWWMVRSDRLSHPVALVFDTDKIYGFSTSPYFIKKDGLKQQWSPRMQGDFYQYGGFTCSLEKGTLGFTIGYENAPLLFVKSHDVRERAPLNENCFTLEAGETVEICMDLYEFDAISEADINPVIEAVYYRYHQSPRIVGSIKTAVSDLAMAVFKDAWIPQEDCYAGQVFEEADGSYRYNKIQ